MKITDAQRRHLGERIAAKRLEWRDGTKSAAYRDADLNSATWNRIEEGLPVRDDRLAAAVKLFWPDTRGDWRRIPEDDTTGNSELERVLDEYGISAAAKARIIAAAGQPPITPTAQRARKAQ